jgi:hypothetical protein
VRSHFYKEIRFSYLTLSLVTSQPVDQFSENSMKSMLNNASHAYFEVGAVI